VAVVLAAAALLGPRIAEAAEGTEAVVASASPAHPGGGGPAQASLPAAVWHAVLVAGDNASRAFDNARHALAAQLATRGVGGDHVVALSRADAGVEPGVADASVVNVQRALGKLQLGPDDRCVVHVTSHGTRDGVLMSGRTKLTPDALDRMLDTSCGARPTVVLVSACYSGNFASSPAMQAPNRIVLTAARDDRTSFGCGVEDQFTFWDGCLLEDLPHAGTWRQLYDDTRACVQRKEAGQRYLPSEPQAWFGRDVMDLAVFEAPTSTPVTTPDAAAQLPTR
jgi:hypothetical protein